MTQDPQDASSPSQHATPPPVPPQAQAPCPPPWAYPPPWQRPRRSWLGRLMTALLVLALIGSVLLNIALAAAVAMGAARHVGMETVVVQDGDSQQVLAVYELGGIIDERSVTSFQAFFHSVADDSNVKAVVLRIESPGGGVAASDQIYNMVSRLRDEAGKTVVVSMGGVAASGGYYISAPADMIIAEPTTLTGSIGVIMAYPVIKQTLDKLGVELVVLKSRRAENWKDEMSIVRQPSEPQRQHLLAMLDQMQERFEQIVREGRGDRLKTMEHAEIGQAPEVEPFNGKVYAAQEAVELGLVDSIGYLEQALGEAASLAGLDRPRIVRYQPRRGLLERVLAEGGSSSMQITARTLDELQTPRLMMMWKVD